MASFKEGLKDQMIYEILCCTPIISVARCNFYARVYATEIHGLCWRAAAATVHATDRPTNAPAQKRARKREGGRENERDDTCA